MAALVSLTALAGCSSSISDQVGSSFWVSPGKYTYHSCLQVLRTDQAMAVRQKETEELMARAAKGGSGAEAIGTAVYRSRYQQVIGERQELAKVMQEKRCQVDSPRASERSVF